MELLVCTCPYSYHFWVPLLLIIRHRYNWAIILPAELSAASVLIGFWNKAVNPAVWVTVCMIVVIIINLLGAGE